MTSEWFDFTGMFLKIEKHNLALVDPIIKIRIKSEIFY
jgi:hypothetical protein